MPLDPAVLAKVAHLYDATLQQFLTGEVSVAVGEVAPLPDIDVREIVFDGPHGTVPARLYVPEGRPAPLPVLVWNHGGGWAFGDIDMPEADGVSQRFASWAGVAVASVDYRLAPNNTFPVPVDDIVAVVRGLVDGAADLGLDGAQVGLGGASAGAHLATLATRALLDDGMRPTALVLAYPLVDAVGGPYPSAVAEECPPVLWLDAFASGGLFAMHVGGDPAAAPDAAVPARIALADFPPTLVTTAEFDGLTMQAEAHVARLDAAGVEVEHHRVEGVLHGYLNLVGDVAVADDALRLHAAWLAEHLVLSN